MKVKDYMVIEGNEVTFVGSKNKTTVDNIKSVELVVRALHKGAVDTVLNAATNALSQSIANGNEPTNIIINVYYNDDIESIVLNDEPLIKGNLDYHDFVKRARRLKDAFTDVIKENGGLA